MKIILLFISALVLRIVLSVFIYSGDLNNHWQWSKGIVTYGGWGAYEREYPGVMKPTYPPLALYGFNTGFFVHTTIINTTNWLNKNIKIFPSKIIWLLEDQDVPMAWQKTMAIVADMGIGILIYIFTGSFILSALYLFNPAVWYNSSLWGQIDAIPIFLVILACYFLTRKNSLSANLAFGAALLTKQSAIIFAPIFAIWHFKKFGLKQTLVGLMIQFGLLYLCYLPLFGKFDLLYPVKIYIDRIQTGSGSNFIADHAFNFWALYSRLQKIPDTNVSWIGFVAFGIIYSLVLTRKPSFLSMAVIQISAFLFLTRMHERYLAPAIPLLFLSIRKSKLLFMTTVVLSTAHLANLYHDWWYPRIPVLVDFLSKWSNIEYIVLSIGICWLIAFKYLLWR